MPDDARAAAGSIKRASSVKGRIRRTSITNICRQTQFRPQAKAKNSPTRMRQRNRSVIVHPHLLGDDVPVCCDDGAERRYVNLDYAGSTPVMAEVRDAVEAFADGGDASEEARADVARFAGARTSDTVVWVRNATEAISVLAASLPAGSKLLCSGVEMGRRHDVRALPPSHSPADLIEAASHALRKSPADLIAITGASSVTGEVWPVAELAAIAHYHGAKLFVDAAQLAPHRAIDMKRTGIDYLALSGDKLYAPFGAGALVGAALEHGDGSPNAIGAVALGAACRALRAMGMDELARRERALAFRLWAGLAEVPGLRDGALVPAAPRRRPDARSAARRRRDPRPRSQPHGRPRG